MGAPVDGDADADDGDNHCGNNYDYEFMVMVWSSFFKKSYKTEQPNGSGATEWSALATGGLRSSSTLCHVMRIMMVALAMVEN